MSLLARLFLVLPVLFYLTATASAQGDIYKMPGTQPAGTRRAVRELTA
jgi:hypothetical protein